MFGSIRFVKDLQMSSDIVIRVQNLGKCYNIYSRPKDRLKQTIFPKIQRVIRRIPEKKYYKEFWALRDISFEAKRGDRIGIIGKNGSGKSTLLQLIAGTLTPTCGSVEVNGRVAALLELGSGFNPEFTGRENVFHYASVLGMSREYIDERFDEIVKFADIGAFVDSPLKTYSSGMCMRLAFATATNIEPDILIIDEALSVGDAIFSFKCAYKMDELISKNGTTLLFVSHDTNTIKQFCDSAIYLKNGQCANFDSASIVSEYYYQDIRNEQNIAIGKPVIKEKKSLANNLSFGSEDGAVKIAHFLKTKSELAEFTKGEIIEFMIMVQWKKNIQHPQLTVMINTFNMLPIGGDSFPLGGGETGPDMSQLSVHCSFSAKLFNGKYLITARLDDRISKSQVSVIEKQAGVLEFTIVDGAAPCAGYSDMEINFTAMDV